MNINTEKFQPLCPVCSTEYQEDNITQCPVCNWDLTLSKEILSEKYKSQLLWAKEIWLKLQFQQKQFHT